MALPAPVRSEPRQAFKSGKWTPAAERPAAVYRIYDAAEKTIYIGVGYDPFGRVRFHANTQSWGHLIDSWSADWYSTRDDAEMVEAALIEAEQPIYNVRGTELHRAVSLRLVPGTHLGDIASYHQPIPPSPTRPRHGVRRVAR